MSALWFARSDIETEDHWFNGFPAVWNLAVPTYLVLNLKPNTVAVVTLILCVSQLTMLKFPHIIRVKAFRFITLPFGVLYIGNLFYLSWSYSNETGIHHQIASEILMSVFPLYIAVISLWRTFKSELDEVE
jgi:phosphatidylcholine synthase